MVDSQNVSDIILKCDNNWHEYCFKFHSDFNNNNINHVDFIIKDLNQNKITQDEGHQVLFAYIKYNIAK